MEEKFGDFIKRLRNEKGYSLEELSKISGFTQMEIRNIESNKNKPRIYNLNRLAEALDCSFECLFNKIDSKN